MSCKCGTTVKADECAVGITRSQVNETTHFAKCASLQTATLPRKRSPDAYWRKTGQDKGAAPIRQDRGAIEVGCDSIAPGDDESRSPRR
jgi:hypothetical protein